VTYGGADGDGHLLERRFRAPLALPARAGATSPIATS